MSFDVDMKRESARVTCLSIQMAAHDINQQLHNGVIPKATLQGLKELMTRLSHEVREYRLAKRANT